MIIFPKEQPLCLPNVPGNVLYIKVYIEKGLKASSAFLSQVYSNTRMLTKIWFRIAVRAIKDLCRRYIICVTKLIFYPQSLNRCYDQLFSFYLYLNKATRCSKMEHMIKTLETWRVNVLMAFYFVHIPSHLAYMELLSGAIIAMSKSYKLCNDEL